MDKQMHEMTLPELKEAYAKAKRTRGKTDTDKRKIRAFETWIARRKREASSMRKVV